MLSVNRRAFMQALGATAITSTMGLPAIAAPKRGGHLRLALAGGASQDNLDPASVIYDAAFLTMATARSTLTNIEPNGQLSPNLAETWDASTDFTKWTFYIRPGVTFHSGKPLAMDDIVASLNLHRGKDSTSPAKALLKAVTDIAVEGSNKIVFTLNAPNVEFPNVLRDVRLAIVPSKDGKADRGTTDGTGPYMIESFEPGQRIRFKRNPNHWDGENVGFFETAEVLIINDAAARMNALRSGQVDLINSADLKTLKMLEQVPGITVEDVPSGRYYIFAMMANAAPFNDKNVRQALKYAINRKELVDKVLLGHGVIGNDQPIDSKHKYFNAQLPQREYDPDKVKFFMKAAGLTTLSVPLSVAESAFDGASAAGSLYVASAGSAGISIDLTREPSDGYFENVWMKKPFTVDYWNRQSTADTQFTMAYAKESPWNETQFNSERFNELLVKARATADESTRTEMYHEMQQLVYEDSGSIIPMFANYVWAKKANLVHSAELSSDYDLDGFRCVTRWWFD